MYVEMKNIKKKYGDFVATDDVTFQVEEGKLVGLLGASGSGKTTLLRILAGLETADSGEIIIDGKTVNNIPSSKRGIGFVFQNYALFQHMTVYENVAFGLKIKKMKKADIEKRALEMIELVGLKGKEKNYPSQLSGGQKQRVAFARAIAPNPKLLLLDEPFAAIDAKIRTELRTWLKDMVHKLGITSIFVTHDQDEALEVADEIIVTNKGKIEQMGTPRAVYRHPKTAYVAKFFGKGTVLENGSKLSQFPDISDWESMVVRPEFVKITKKNEFQKYSSSVTEAEVIRVSFRGDYTEVLLNCEGIEITGKRGLDEAAVTVGEKVDIFIEKVWAITDNHVKSIHNAATIEESVVI